MKLTPETHATIVKLVNAGVPIKLAANAAGVGDRTVMTWLGKGRKDGARGKYREFADDVDKARGTYAGALTMRVNKASDKDWRAAAWMLERRFASEFAEVNKHRVAGDPDNPTPIAVEVTEECEQAAARLSRLLLEETGADE